MSYGGMYSECLYGKSWFGGKGVIFFEFYIFAVRFRINEVSQKKMQINFFLKWFCVDRFILSYRSKKEFLYIFICFCVFLCVFVCFCVFLSLIWCVCCPHVKSITVLMSVCSFTVLAIFR